MFLQFLKLYLIWSTFVTFAATLHRDESSSFAYRETKDDLLLEELFRVTYKGNQYLIVKAPRKTWVKSVQWCSRNNASLISFSDDSEFNFAREFARKAGLPRQSADLFIGASKLLNHKGFTWISNDQTIQKSFWSAGQPDNSGGIENCATLHYGGKGEYKVNDDRCDALRPFMCISG